MGQWKCKTDSGGINGCNNDRTAICSPIFQSCVFGRLRLSPSSNDASVRVALQIRTLQSDGLLLYSGSGVVDRDFLSVELVDGRPRYMFDTGDGPRTVVVNATRPVSDGDWHDIAIVRTNVLTTSGHALVVDGHVAYEQPADNAHQVARSDNCLAV